jgi:cation diffusion facilitator CzcD-associated flavoprotein CzcO
MTSTSPRVLVIGAGTGGLALAHGLVRAGIAVRVFEGDALRYRRPARLSRGH